VESCDVLIATTEQDEVNMLCCLIARKASKCRTIARVRNPDYFQEIDFIRDGLGLSMVINPESAAAEECYHILRAPGVSEIDSFAGGRVQMVTAQLPENSKWVGQKLLTINQGCDFPFLIAVVVRGRQVFIPRGNSVLEAGDMLSIVVDNQDMNQMLYRMGVEFRRVRNVMIAGCGNVGYYLATRLLKERFRIKIIEPSLQRCEELAALLPGAEIIHGNYHNEKVLDEEGVAQMDAVAALSANDSDNIVLALYVNKVSDAQVITRINKVTFGGVLSEIPLGVAISPKALTAEHILRYARAIGGTEVDSRMEAIYLLADGRVEALSFTVMADCPLIGVELQALHQHGGPRLRKGVLFGAIIRENQVIIPSGHDAIRKGDLVIVLTEHKGTRKLRDVLE
jgi:trk system potassium uptake protein TrkA